MFITGSNEAVQLVMKWNLAKESWIKYYFRGNP